MKKNKHLPKAYKILKKIPNWIIAVIVIIKLSYMCNY